MSTQKLILLAEDSPPDAEMTVTALAECGAKHQIVVVSDGEAALDFLHYRGAYADRPTGSPALVVLDLKMPKIDGLEVLRTIRADAKLQMTPVVMLTSSREEQDVLRSYQFGINAYVVKPVDFRNFVEAVRTLGTFWIQLNEPAPPPPAASFRSPT